MKFPKIKYHCKEYISGLTMFYLYMKFDKLVLQYAKFVRKLRNHTFEFYLTLEACIHSFPFCIFVSLSQDFSVLELVKTL